MMMTTVLMIDGNQDGNDAVDGDDDDSADDI